METVVNVNFVYTCNSMSFNNRMHVHNLVSEEGSVFSISCLCLVTVEGSVFSTSCLCLVSVEGSVFSTLCLCLFISTE